MSVDNQFDRLVESIGFGQVVPGIVANAEERRKPNLTHLLPGVLGQSAQVEHFFRPVVGTALVSNPDGRAAPVARLVGNLEDSFSDRVDL